MNVPARRGSSDPAAADGPDPLQELLTAAVPWSCAGDSRVLLTSRTRDFGHPDYRQLAREAKRNFAGTAHEMKRHAELIAAVVAVCAGQDDFRDLVAAHVGAMRQGGGEWLACADAIGNILVGERDEQRLCEETGPTASMIVETILHAIADPTTLSALLPSEGNTNT